MFSAFFVVALRLASLPLAVACAADDPSVPGGVACVASSAGSHEGNDDAALLELDDSDDDEAAYGSAPLMSPPSSPVRVPTRAAALGLGRGARPEVLALASHVRDLDRPPRA
jgi:hypothetical protein